MNIFGKIRKFWNDLSLTNPKAWDRSLWNLFGSQSLSGETVTESTALNYSAVYNATSLISGTIASLPLHLMQRKAEKKRIADDYKLYALMHDQWNPYMTSMAGRECLMAHILLWGNGYAEKVKNSYGEVRELWPITPDRVTPRMTGNELVYEISMPDRQDIILSRDKVLHIPGLGFDGFVGYSVVSMARKSIGLGMALETFGSLYFGQGTHPGVVVSHPGVLKTDVRQALKTSLTETYSGLGQSHRLMLLEEGMKLEKIGIPPNDSQFLESRQFQIPEIARWFNLPPHKLKDLTRSSFSNIESEQISFVTDSILPWLVRLEQNYWMQLLTESDRNLSGRGRLYFKHSVEGLMRGDSASRSAFYVAMVNNGIMTRNEVRALEDLDPDSDPNADKLTIQLNMSTLDKIGEKSEPKFLPNEENKNNFPEPEEPEKDGNGNKGRSKNEMVSDNVKSR